ncbi:MAG: GcrA family cell cycle regulator [Geminicoccaceae bacterium]
MSWWVPEQDAVLRTHWGKGKTAAEIGKLLGKNKNQVIGRANRLGLQTPKPEHIDTRPRSGPGRRRKLSVIRPKGPRVLSAGADGCQWLDGEPRERRFCGDPVREGSSFCDDHHQRCWIKHEDYRSEAA